MKKVLYVTNIETPYRVRFFNELAKYCYLTVLYEKRTVEERNVTWAKSEESKHTRKYLPRESVLFSGILSEIQGEYDVIIIGCYNSPNQIIAQFYMRLFGIPYIINLDGEPFINGKGIKNYIKKFFLSGASKYLVAGEKAATSIMAVAKNKRIVPYYFSSLTKRELEDYCRIADCSQRDKTVLVIGQYFEYKGMDVALEVAKMDQSIKYKFVGMGSRTECFINDYEIPSNVEIIPFLQKEELEKEYQTCGVLLLPSRKECWGLVVNEAAAHGMPIVSTWGSGAAIEFLEDHYPQYLAKPGDAKELLFCLRRFFETPIKVDYCQFLLDKSSEYNIERSAAMHIYACLDDF